MQKLHYSIIVDAPRERVWDAMLNQDTYRLWTELFMPGSCYVGNWDQGSKMLFLAPDKNGKMAGMVSRIKENKKYEYISIEHLGMVKDGVEDTSSEAAKKWAGALENYTFKRRDDGIEVLVDIDVEDSLKEMFQDIWPKALQRLKEIAEK